MNKNESSEILLKMTTVYSFGHGYNGCLGNGQENILYEQPTEIPFKFENVTHIAGGFEHVAMVNDDQLYMWGNFRYGRLGARLRKNQNVPRLVHGFSNITSVSCGMSNSAFVSHGELYTFGGIDHGHKTTKSIFVPTKVNGLRNVTMVSCSSYSTSVIADNKLWLCINNEFKCTVDFASIQRSNRGCLERTPTIQSMIWFHKMLLLVLDGKIYALTDADNYETIIPVKKLSKYGNIKKIASTGCNILFIGGTKLYKIISDNRGVVNIKNPMVTGIADFKNVTDITTRIGIRDSYFITADNKLYEHNGDFRITEITGIENPYLVGAGWGYAIVVCGKPSNQNNNLTFSDNIISDQIKIDCIEI